MLKEKTESYSDLREFIENINYYSKENEVHEIIFVATQLEKEVARQVLKNEKVNENKIEVQFLLSGMNPLLLNLVFDPCKDKDIIINRLLQNA